MTTRRPQSFKKIIIKLFLVILALFILALGTAYTWFIYNSKQLLINMINERSAGKFKLALDNATFDLINSEITIHTAKITSTPKNTMPITHDVSFRQITLHTNSIWSLLAKRSLEIKQIKAFDPVIEVYKNHFTNNPDSNKNLSIGLELGKIYNSIQEGISALRTQSIYIYNAKLILNNGVTNGKKPIVLSNIYFKLNKLNEFNKEPGQYLENNDLDFNSTNQDIVLSDGIHKLSFKKLSIEHASNIILDSCTIIALPTHTTGNNYTINFKKLALVDVDFNSLYRKNIIRADSAYCEDPVTNINLNSTLADSDKVAKGAPDIEKILKSIAGNLDLGYVAVINANIHLNVKGKKTLTNFHSGKVNFQINKLRINPDSSKLISMDNFNMMVKGYQLYNSDSTSVFSFDSVRFSNSKLLLNNFTIHTISSGNKIRNYRDYTIPYFELLGIDWSELIFRQNLKARIAILHKPNINFIKNKKLKISNKLILFNSHHSLDDLMDIEKLKIINGIMNINWGINNSLELKGLNLNLLSNNLTDYKHVKFNQDIESLFFTTGVLTIGDIQTKLRNVIFNEKDHVLADELFIQNKKGGFYSKIYNVSINKINSDANNGNFLVDGLKWSNGTIKLEAIAGNKKKHKASSILLENTEGKQTQFQIIENENNANVFINNIQIAYFLKNSNHPFVMKGLLLKGSDMNVSNDFTRMNAKNFNLSDSAQEFKNTRLEKNNHAGSLIVAAPYIKLTGDLSDYFSKDFHFKNVVLQSPEISYKKKTDSATVPGKVHRSSPIIIDHLSITEPALDIRDSTSGTGFLLPYSAGSEIKINDLEIDSAKITAATLHLATTGAEISNENKSSFKIDSTIDLDLEKINFSNDANKVTWNASLTNGSVKNSDGFRFNLDENTLSLKDINMGNVSLNSDILNSPVKLLTANPGAWLSTSSAKYINKNSSWQADNVKYDGILKELKAGSFNYHPLLSRDSVIASSPYQTDYIYYHSGKSTLNGFDLLTLLNQDSLLIQKANFVHPAIHVYRDKLPPFLTGVRKKLFTEEIKKIDLPVSIKEVLIDEGKVIYIEKNEKSRLNADLTLTHLNGNITNIKNYQLQPSDSLSLNIKGRILDKEPFDLDLHQSYQDSLYGFVMNLATEPIPLNFLNPLLIPLSNVKFVSGNLNYFKMHALGNDNSAYGEMKFYYHDLHIRLLKNGGLEKTTILKCVESNLVDFFLVKNNNTSRTGLIYFERLRDRSFFNYMVKLIYSGVNTSIGVQKNRNYRKFYKKNDIQFK